MDRKYWIIRGNITMGPYKSFDEAKDAGHELRRNDKKPNHKEILIGYGEYGPHFDLRWF